MTSGAVVIGGGLGGLAAAVTLARKGVPVTLLEKEPRVGGYAIAYRRRGYTFDLALHAVAGGAPGQELHNLLDALGVGTEVKLLRLREGFRVWLGQQSYRLPNSREELFAFLAQEFPAERAALEAFDADVRRHMKVYAPVFDAGVSRWKALPPFLPRIPAFLRQGTLPVGAYLDSFFQDQRLKALLYQAAIFMGMPSAEFPTINFLMMFHFLFGLGMYTLSGGGQALTDALGKKLTSLGGRVVTGAAAREILIDGGAAIGVRDEAGEEHPASAVVAAVSLPQVAEDLLPRGQTSGAYRTTWQRLKPSLSVLVLQMGLDRHPREVGLDNHLTISFPDADLDSCLARQRKGILPEGFSLTAQGNTDGGESPGSWVVSAVAGTDPAKWLSMSDETYRDAKEHATKEFLRLIDGIYPGFSGRVRVSDLVTPRTLQRYTGNPSGAIMGFACSCGTHRDLWTVSRPSVRRLYLAGAWTQRLGGFMQCLRSGVSAGEKAAKEMGRRA